MDSKAMLLLFLLLATILHFTPTASSLDHHEELNNKVYYVKALAKLPRPPTQKSPPPPPPDCFRLCRKWCMPRPWWCMGVCTLYCDRCRCVPPFTLRNGGRCRKCYIDVAVYG